MDGTDQTVAISSLHGVEDARRQRKDGLPIDPKRRSNRALSFGLNEGDQGECRVGEGVHGEDGDSTRKMDALNGIYSDRQCRIKS